jgi:dTDP-4-dehydrorhamnose reductase
MKRILVTGGTGLLGSSLVPFLKAAGYAVTANGHASRADVNCDLADGSACHDVLESCTPDIIINLAALTNVDRCETDLRTAFRLNVQSVENLCEWIGQRGGRCRMLQVSTDQVYDGAGPHREKDVTISNSYAMTKYAAELAAQRVDACILRTNFFGRSSLSGRRSFSDWLLDALHKRQQIRIFTDVMFSPLAIDTLCEMILRVLEMPRAGRYNLGSHDGMSKAEFAISLANVFGLDDSNMQRSLAADFSFKAYRPKDMRMDCTLFEETFDVRLPTLQQEIDKLRMQYDA